jgi:CTP synthase
MAKFIFITGGVVSSLGKGLASAALGALLQARGYKIRLKKLDPYLNVDPGTMSPYQHGEVFVTDDGAETDLDLGHYERFTGVAARKGDNTTAGRIYSQLLTKERRGDYLGGTVQVIPHVTDLIKDFIRANTESTDFVLCEIGGTVGDIEALPFFEAIRQMGYELDVYNSMYIHLTLVPYIATAKELKTKPTQHSVKELRSIGIQPNLLLCRSEKEIPVNERKKIALFCNIKEESVIQALDQKSIYRVPLAYHAEGLDREVLKHFHLPYDIAPNLEIWQNIVNSAENPSGEVKIAVVGKYNRLKDAYKSLIEAFSHAGIHHKTEVKLVWVNAASITEENINDKLAGVHGLMVPGGFGDRGTEGKIKAIRYARENNLPFFGICLGMQLATIEAARNVLGIENASSTEFRADCSNIIGLMTEWEKDGSKEKRDISQDLGGSMRLGAYECKLKPGSLVHSIYEQDEISERHRHRYEFNINFKEKFEKAGFLFSGTSPDESLMEVFEYPKNDWFIGVQYHPELKSKPFLPHPLFTSFVKAAINKKESKEGNSQYESGR